MSTLNVRTCTFWSCRWTNRSSLRAIHIMKRFTGNPIVTTVIEEPSAATSSHSALNDIDTPVKANLFIQHHPPRSLCIWHAIILPFALICIHGLPSFALQLSITGQAAINGVVTLVWERGGGDPTSFFLRSVKTDKSPSTISEPLDIGDISGDANTIQIPFNQTGTFEFQAFAERKRRGFSPRATASK
ncbi:hypothetical protein ARMSODRAFT_615158 [Armillaria solidipes]|uniref:Uncharacterized protein n=1 Tax=Armillaria solidipes TaxID=1076256 RepID=A0A2H3AZH8_9AGAR|nr:hypothetical protein ARMSODRAFT_615158 [Armillaria solidipes]